MSSTIHPTALIDPSLGVVLDQAAGLNDYGQIIVAPYLLTPVHP